MVINILTSADICIKYDDRILLLLVTWICRQTEDSFVEGCWRIHQAMLPYEAFKILNDNRHLVGIGMPLLSGWAPFGYPE